MNKKIRPFFNFCIENFPFIEATYEAIDNYELWCHIVKKLNEVVDNTNKMGEIVDKINNYFVNLNVQDEVNKKLDEMAESGELAELVSQYLESQAIIGFNTINDLKNATNLANGSFAKTYGRNIISDGDGNFYKIRNRTNQDTPDDYNLIVLSNTTNLIAERIPNMYDKNLHNLTYRISKKLNTKIVCAGDSLTYGTNPVNAEQSSVTYPNSLQSFINNWLESPILTCVNKGIPGALSSAGIEHFNEYLEENPNTIIWSYGTNDITQNKTIDEIINNLNTFKKLCYVNNIELIVLIPPTSFQNPYRAEMQENLQISLISYCRKNGLTYVDLYKYLQNAYNNGSYNRYLLQSDSTHFTDYKVFRDAIIYYLFPFTFKQSYENSSEYVTNLINTKSQIKCESSTLRQNIDVSETRNGISLTPQTINFETNFVLTKPTYLYVISFYLATGLTVNCQIDGQAFTLTNKNPDGVDNTNPLMSAKLLIPFRLNAGLHNFKILSASESSGNFLIFGFEMTENMDSIEEKWEQRKVRTELFAGNLTSTSNTSFKNLIGRYNELRILIGGAGRPYTWVTINPNNAYQYFTENLDYAFVIPFSNTSYGVVNLGINATNNTFSYNGTSPIRRIYGYCNNDLSKYEPLTKSGFENPSILSL